MEIAEKRTDETGLDMKVFTLPRAWMWVTHFIVVTLKPGGRAIHHLFSNNFAKTELKNMVSGQGPSEMQ